MNFGDILAMAIHNLWQRRMRTLMNQAGVVIGCIVLLMTASGASSVKDAFQALFDSSEFARQVEVYQSYGFDSSTRVPEGAVEVEGEMDDDRRERIRESLERIWKSKNLQKTSFRITPEIVDQFERLDHVDAVVPQAHLACRVHVGSLSADEEPLAAGVSGAGLATASMKRSLIAGEPLGNEDRTGILVHELLAYQLGFRSDAQLLKLVGQELSIEVTIKGRLGTMFRMIAGGGDQEEATFGAQEKRFLKTFDRLIADLDKTSLTEAQKTLLRGLLDSNIGSGQPAKDVTVNRTYVVRGVYREGANGSLSRIFRQQLMGYHVRLQVHRDEITELHLLNPDQQEFGSAVVLVDSTRNLGEVTEKLKADGAHFFSSLQIIESINRNIDRSSWLVYGLAAAILLIAAIGISNTLIISVMERTPEFGIMKSLGAKDRDLVLLMMVEGAVLGVFGAFCAVLISWLLSFVVQFFLTMYMEWETGGALTSLSMHFSVMPILLTFAIAILVCAAASVAPAIRAARLDPVVAMQRT